MKILNHADTESASRLAASFKTPDGMDKAGASAALLCSLHCALMPFIATMLPLLGLSFLASEPVEWALVGTSATLGVGSLCLGYREHRSRRALAVLSTGLALLALGHLSEEHSWTSYGMPLMVGGGLTMAAAHFLNLKLCQACRSCRPGWK